MSEEAYENLMSQTKFHNFFGINMRSLYAKFQLSSFKTEGGDRSESRRREIEMIIVEPQR